MVLGTLAALILSAPTIVFCAPGYPGSSAEAQPVMDAFARALSAAEGGAFSAVYEQAEDAGVQRLQSKEAAVAVTPLPFLLAHEKDLKLSPRLAVVSKGAEATEAWSLVAKKGRIKKPQDLARFQVASSAGYAPSFVRHAFGAWGAIPETAKVIESGQVLSYLRKASAGEDVALVLDGAQSASVPSLPFAGDLETVARSAPVPTGLVSVVAKRLTQTQEKRLERALLELHGDALDAVRISRFITVDDAALEAARSWTR